ncbi:DNA polymerase III subunit beta [Helicobacter sp. NHP22-001]|uniref:DNA polymerase III subunit beta n=1 Tax=Helicobacter sp. NHP22-001 TaxID=3040202 RepID=UPI00244D83AF|nr:DNA polymerase III subunit beta [Helicobacter sp. NHP22-001]GMB96154.1 DNA polymerase III subunit beta DnaN [Helicobacter sp. NHP22-001]
MQLTIDKVRLERALQHLVAFTDRKDLANIASHVCLEAKDGGLRLEANDLEMGLCLHLEAHIVKEGSATFNAKHFLDIASKLENGDLSLEADSDFVHVRFKRSKFKLPLFDRNDFPAFPSHDNLPFLHFGDGALSEYFKKLAPVIKTNASKYEFGGVLMVLKETLELAATDTRRLSLVQMDAENMPEESLNTEYILPKRAMLEISKLFESDFDMFYEPKDPSMLFFKNDEMVLYSKLIGGKYPNYEAIFPKEFAHQFELETQSFKEAIQITSALSPTTKIVFYPEHIEFESLENESPSFSSTSIETKTPLEGFELQVQARHLLDALNTSASANFTLSLNQSTDPFLVEKDGFKTLIMPFVS